MAKVIIRWGQSNSAPHETTANLQAGYKQAYPNIQTWTGAAFASLDWTQNNNGYPATVGLFSSEYALLSTLQSSWNETIYDIKYAVGGTQLGTYLSTSVNWNANTRGSYYDAAISTVNNALAYMWNTLGIRDYTFYIVQDQGESDTRTTENAGNYQTNITAFINAFRANLSGSALANSKKYFIIPRVNENIHTTSGAEIITDATNATPIVITSSVAHGFTTDQTVTISGVVGNTAANGVFKLTVVNATQYSLQGSAGNGAYVSGGDANTWSLSSTVNTAQVNAAAALSDVYTLNCNSYSLKDRLHYDATGYNDKGIATANLIINNSL